MESHFITGVRKTIEKIRTNANLVKIIQCRNSYERRIVHMLAEEHGLEHEKVRIRTVCQKKRLTPMYSNGVRLLNNNWDRRLYYDDVYGVKLYSPISVRREPELRKKLAREILSELLIDDIAKIVCKKI